MSFKMKVGSMLFVLLLFVTGIAAAQPRAAVLDFQNKTPNGGWAVGQGASDMLATEIVKSRKFRVIEREKLKSILKEQGLSLSGAIDPSTAVKVGRLLGVEYIITGAVTEYGQSRSGASGRDVRVGKTGYHAAVDVRIVSATTGEIVFADSGSHSESSIRLRLFGYRVGEKFNEKKATDTLRGAIKDFAAKIDVATLTGYGIGAGGTLGTPRLKGAKIADVSGNTVVINRGSGSGLKTGQTKGVYRPGRVIKDPDTGKVLKQNFDQVGQIELTTVAEGYSEGRIVSGSGLKVGDIVK
jgi:curli biogenesis system outer membrane secretion channel CsgG